MTTFYVDAKSGNDRNDGTENSPFSNIQKAADVAQAGDTVYVKAGAYKPFEIESSGTEDAPITFSAYPGQEHDVIIDGSGTSPRGLIMARGESHLTIEGFKIQNASTDGIFIEGSKQGEHGIQLLDNVVDTTGNSGIYVSGQIMGQTIGVDEYRLFDVLIEGNEVTNTNFPSGGNEAISLGGGVDGFVIRDNWVHDSEQYGIDAKFGAINGEISGNLIHGIEKHAIYLDSNSRTIANIDIFGNEMYDNNNGIVLARESTRSPKEPNIYNIDIFDNTVQNNNKYGVMLYGHRADIGTGKFDDIQIFNNVVTDNGTHGFHLKGVSFAEGVVVAANDVSGNGRDYLNEINATISDNLGIIDTTGLVGYDPDAQSGDLIGVSDEPKSEPKPQPEPKPEPEPEPKPEPKPEPQPEPKPEPSPQEPADPTASDEGPVLVRMNAGGGAIGDWSSDAGYRNETSGDRNATNGAADDRLVEGLGIPAEVLETESFSNASDGLLSYGFDVEAGKEVELRLVFGEGYDALKDADGSGDPTGDRIFDVVIDDEFVFDDLDPYAVAGGFDQPFVLTHQMTSDGTIDIDLVKDGPENPQIRAIEIVEQDMFLF